MYQGKTVAAVIPAYNEAGFVGDVIDTLPSFIDRAYVIDDASTDDTWAEIQDRADAINDEDRTTAPVTDGGVELHPRIVPIQHDENRGVGGAIKTGYQAALDDEVDVTVVVSGDGQTKPDILERIIRPVVAGEAGYAKGNRLLDQDREAMPAFRRVGNYLLTWLTRVSSGYWGMMDPQNGSTAIAASALEAADIEGMYEGYGYCNDLLARLNAAEVRVADVSRRAVYEDEESHIDYHTYIPRVSLLLLQNFVWRLYVKYASDGAHPVPLAYSVGVLGTATAITREVRRHLGEPSGNAWLTVGLAVAGVAALLTGMVVDRATNRGLTVQHYDR